MFLKTKSRIRSKILVCFFIIIYITHIIAKSNNTCSDCENCIIEDQNDPQNTLINQQCQYKLLNISNSTIGNLTPSDTNKVYFKADTIIIQNSTIKASDILINATKQFILINSSIVSDGASPFMNQSNCFTGNSGRCSSQSQAISYYGSFDQLDVSNNNITFGSGNNDFPGGGRIVIATNNFSIQSGGKISTHGLPNSIDNCTSSSNDTGSGGFIYLNYTNINVEGGNFILDASGGNACSNNQTGLGSGGRIVCANRCNISSQNVEFYAYGGVTNQPTCTNGAAGTIFLNNPISASNIDAKGEENEENEEGNEEENEEENDDMGSDLIISNPEYSNLRSSETFIKFICGTRSQ